MKKLIAGFVAIIATIVIGGACSTLPNIKESSNDISTEISVKGIPAINLWGDMSRLSDEFDIFFDWVEKTNQKHIIINIHSPGGSTQDILYIVHRMEILKNKGMIIETRVISSALSGGFILFVSGTKGCRKTHKNAMFMIHGLQSRYGPVDAESTPTNKAQSETMERLLSKSLGISVPEVQKLTRDRKNHYFTGNGMLARKWADEILE